MTKRPRLRFSRSIVQRARRLLHMRYRPGELAEELGCSVRMIYRRYIPAGCPCERDQAGHLWIIGDKFRDWMLAVQREAVAEGRAKLAEGQAYCMICERAVEMEGPFEIRPVNPYMELVTGRCAECGAVVCRGRKRSKQDDQPTELP